MDNLPGRNAGIVLIMNSERVTVTVPPKDNNISPWFPVSMVSTFLLTVSKYFILFSL